MNNFTRLIHQFKRSTSSQNAYNGNSGCEPIKNLPLIFRGVLKSRYISKKCFDFNEIVEFSRAQHTIDGTDISLVILKSKSAVNTLKVWRALEFFVPLLNHLSGHMPNINLALYNSLEKKMLPIEKGEILSPVHVNSGLTDGRCIFVFRKEEMLKVILHELIHYYGIDYDSSLYKTLEDNLKKRVGLESNNMALSECYTETISTLMMVGYNIACDLSLHDFRVAYAASMNKMIVYSGTIACRIMQYQEVFTENTHVFAYYVAKAACLHNLDEFLAFLNEDYVLRKDDAKIIKFYSLVSKWVMQEHIFTSERVSKRSLKMMNS